MSPSIPKIGGLPATNSEVAPVTNRPLATRNTRFPINLYPDANIEDGKAPRTNKEIPVAK
jgi:hypothetical protein